MLGGEDIMDAVNEEKSWFLRLDRGEDLFSTLEKWAHENKLKSGHLSGIGALQDVELGAYHLDRKEYERKVFPDICELLSLEGNLSFNDGKPFFHIHAVLGDHDFKTYGGHLFKATVAVTCEVHFRVFDHDVERKPNQDIGLSLLTFCQA
jgi:predicted DNA-binding protein with PD1-like motif